MDKEIERLSEELENQWDEMGLEELAERIIALEKRVAALPISGSERLRKKVERFHFRFVFPVALEFDLSRCDKSMPRSFAKTINYMADRVFKTGSVSSFSELNGKQQEEILKLAGGEG